MDFEVGEPKPREKAISLLDIICRLFEEEKSSSEPPLGVEEVEIVTSEAVRIKFLDKVDYDLLCRIAAEEGFVIEAGRFTPRVVDRGAILARVGSRSDPGREHDIFIYLFPSMPEKMSTYMKSVAAREGVLDIETRKMNLERFYEYNLRAIGRVEKYRRNKYQDLTRMLEL